MAKRGFTSGYERGLAAVESSKRLEPQPGGNDSWAIGYLCALHDLKKITELEYQKLRRMVN